MAIKISTVLMALCAVGAFGASTGHNHDASHFDLDHGVLSAYEDLDLATAANTLKDHEITEILQAISEIETNLSKLNCHFNMIEDVIFNGEPLTAVILKVHDYVVKIYLNNPTPEEKQICEDIHWQYGELTAKCIKFGLITIN